MDIAIGNTVEWVKRSRKGKTVELQVVTGTVAEVRDDHVVIKGRNGRRRRLPMDCITAVNGIRVERPDADEEAQDGAGGN
ncbi:MAG: hypothetical protein IPM39_15250 [Chloroflexi bacterium]|nr:hypothetical protein [Chloroflexota bacterium]